MRLIYPADEWFLLAKREIPSAEYYDEYLQLENGVGMWRMYKDSFSEELEYTDAETAACDRCGNRHDGSPADYRNGKESAGKAHQSGCAGPARCNPEFFGGNVGVAGLVTATDIIKQCKGKLKSGLLGVPEVMLRAERDMFLDDITIPQLEQELNVKIQILPVDGAGSLRGMLGLDDEE